MSLQQSFAEARSRLSQGQLTLADLDRLLEMACGPPLRQRLLYLYAMQPSLRSSVVAVALHEPVPGSLTQIDPMAPDPGYKTVMDAILEGWRVISFPAHRAAYDDRQIDMVGYEFILEKLERYHV